jgi:hypothetical protein
MNNNTNATRQTPSVKPGTRLESYSIEVVIHPDGQIESEVIGVCGPDCEALTTWLDEIGETVEHHPTPDANRKPPDEQVRTVKTVKTGTS